MILQNGKVFDETNQSVEVDPNQLLRDRQKAMDVITNFENHLVTINAKIDAVKALGFVEIEEDGQLKLELESE